MEKLITIKEAKKLVAGSEERKQELIVLMNKEIESQAQIGKRWAGLPSSANVFEQSWLKDELVLAGFLVQDSHPAVKW
jgi:hypothetical protein